MDKLNIGQHISQQFNEELELVRQKVMEMGGLVESQLTQAVEALVSGNVELAESTERADYRVNACEVNIDEECTRILARRQPAASDLRLVMAVVKTITDLERIGDEAKRVARMAGKMEGDRFRDTTMTEIEHMGQLVRGMLHDVLDAFARTDVDQAFEVVSRDDKVDAKYESITRQLITYMAEEPRTIPVVLNILWAARAMERIGDRSQNIAEYIIYLVRGKDVRHTSLEKVQETAKGISPEDSDG